MGRRRQHRHLGGDVAVRVEAADQRQRRPLEGLLDDRPNLVLDRLVQQQPVRPQPLVLAELGEPALGHRHRVLEEDDQRVRPGKPGPRVGRPPAENGLVQPDRGVGDLEQRTVSRARGRTPPGRSRIRGRAGSSPRRLPRAGGAANYSGSSTKISNVRGGSNTIWLW